MADWAAYWQSPFVWRGLIGLLLIAAHAALTGAFATFRKATFVISGAAHAALAGAALVLVIGGAIAEGPLGPFFGGAIFAIGLALLAATAQQRAGAEETDVTIGVGFAFAMALAVLLISLIPEQAARVWGILLGDLLLLTAEDLQWLAAITVGQVICFVLFWRPFLFVSFDFEGAQAFGLPAGAYNYLLFALMGLSTAILLKSVGAIVLFAMLVAPAATVQLFARTPWQVAMGAYLIALGSGLAAFLLSPYVRFSVSAMAALLACSAYFAARLWRWRQERGNAREKD